MADSKTTALTELTAFDGDETFYVVDDDDGTPVSKRVTLENLTAEVTDGIADAIADGDASTLTSAQASSVQKSLYDANTILKADTDNTPEALAVAEQTLVGRITGGEITALSIAQAVTLLASAMAADASFTGAFAPVASRTCRVYRSAALSLANNGTTAIAWDAETVDTHAMHDTGTNPSRVTLNKVGKYLCAWGVGYASNATGVRDAILALNGSNVSIREIIPGGGVPNYLSGCDIVVASAITDYVEVIPFQNSGGSLAFDVGSTKTFLSVTYLGT